MEKLEYRLQELKLPSLPCSHEVFTPKLIVKIICKLRDMDGHDMFQFI